MPEPLKPSDTPLGRLLAESGDHAPLPDEMRWCDDERVPVTETYLRQPDGTFRYEIHRRDTGELLRAATFSAEGRALSVEGPPQEKDDD